MVRLFADAQELSTRIPEALRELGAEVEMGNLETGTYVLSADLVVERKTAADFAASVLDSRYINQAHKMGMNFKRVIWLIEGDIFSTRHSTHPDALDGALSYLSVVLGQTVVWYKAPKRAAFLLYRMAKHEIEGEGYTSPMRKGRVQAGAGQALFTIEGLSGCGPVAARSLLQHFRSVFKVMTSSVTGLCAVKGIGPKKAQAIHDVIHFELPEGESLEDQQSLFADPPSSEPLV